MNINININKMGYMKSDNYNRLWVWEAISIMKMLPPISKKTKRSIVMTLLKGNGKPFSHRKKDVRHKYFKIFMSIQNQPNKQHSDVEIENFLYDVPTWGTWHRNDNIKLAELRRAKRSMFENAPEVPTWEFWTSPSPEYVIESLNLPILVG